MSWGAAMARPARCGKWPAAPNRLHLQVTPCWVHAALFSPGAGLLATGCAAIGRPRVIDPSTCGRRSPALASDYAVMLIAALASTAERTTTLVAQANMRSKSFTRSRNVSSSSARAKWVRGLESKTSTPWSWLGEVLELGGQGFDGRLVRPRQVIGSHGPPQQLDSPVGADNPPAECPYRRSGICRRQ